MRVKSDAVGESSSFSLLHTVINSFHTEVVMKWLDGRRQTAARKFKYPPQAKDETSSLFLDEENSQSPRQTVSILRVSDHEHDTRSFMSEWHVISRPEQRPWRLRGRWSLYIRTMCLLRMWRSRTLFLRKWELSFIRFSTFFVIF